MSELDGATEDPLVAAVEILAPNGPESRVSRLAANRGETGAQPADVLLVETTARRLLTFRWRRDVGRRIAGLGARDTVVVVGRAFAVMGTTRCARLPVRRCKGRVVGLRERGEGGRVILDVAGARTPVSRFAEGSHRFFPRRLIERVGGRRVELFQPDGGSAPARWLSDIGLSPTDRCTALEVRISPSGNRVVRMLDLHGDPVAVAKLGSRLSDGSRLESERRLIEELAPDAAATGVRIPRARLLRTDRASGVLELEAVRGDRASALAAARDGYAQRLALLLSDWILRWNARTARVRPLGEADIQALIERPLSALRPVLGRRNGYAAFLAQTASVCEGRPFPSVAVHGDLTLSNVIVAGDDEPVAVVDWEHGAPAGAPLTDLVYMLSDAVAAQDAYRMRHAAFRRCFEADGPLRRFVDAVVRQHERALHIDPPLASLFFHACWLRHAANEHAAGRRGAFVAIVETVASREALWGHAR